jgi:hypothetical protein
MEKDLFDQIELMFAGLNRQSAASSLPAPGTLSDILSAHFLKSSSDTDVVARPSVLTNFATAAVEMWLRSVHSFLISISLTRASPIWASVAGYYSSHYSVRAFAHLFGFFQLYHDKRIVRIVKTGSHLVFNFEKKHARDGEHKFYWKCVSEHPQLVGDPFFYAFRDDPMKSDGTHRNKANYSDHIDRFPVFLPLDANLVEDNVERISNIEFSDVPVPRADRFPDIDNVQIVAYHRIVKFRQLVDDVLGINKNRFWRVQRDPSWRPKAMNFSVVEPVLTALYSRR